MSSKVIEQLKEDKNYYGELGGKYLSNSDIIDLLNYKFRENSQRWGFADTTTQCQKN